MPQFGRPSADIVRVDWQEDDGTTVDIFDQIDEVTPDDTDFIRTVLNPTDATYITKLSPVEDPVSSINHTVRFRYQKNAMGGGRVDLMVELIQDYVGFSEPGTVIASTSVQDIPAVWTDGQIVLTGAQADSITDYSNLYLRFTASQIPE